MNGVDAGEAVEPVAAGPAGERIVAGIAADGEHRVERVGAAIAVLLGEEFDRPVVALEAGIGEVGHQAAGIGMVVISGATGILVEIPEHVSDFVRGGFVVLGVGPALRGLVPVRHVEAAGAGVDVDHLVGPAGDEGES